MSPNHGNVMVLKIALMVPMRKRKTAVLMVIVKVSQSVFEEIRVFKVPIGSAELPTVCEKDIFVYLFVSCKY